MTAGSATTTTAVATVTSTAAAGPADVLAVVLLPLLSLLLLLPVLSATATATATTATVPAACAALLASSSTFLASASKSTNPGISWHVFFVLLPLLLPLAFNGDCMILQVCLPNPCKTKVTLSNEGNLGIPFWCNRVLEIAHIYIYYTYDSMLFVHVLAFLGL